MTKLWGSRFTGTSSALAEKFTSSIAYDHKLARYDCLGSMAHARMLGKQKIIPAKDAAALVKGLKKILSQIESGRYRFDPKSEDVHTDIQVKLKKLIGQAADKLHTARSRNDQVALDARMYCIDHARRIIAMTAGLQKSIVDFAAKHSRVIIPAYTHLQSAQLVLMSHHMLAYVEMFERDKGRFFGCIKRTSNNPLGSCALSGSSLPTDRNFVTIQLGLAQTSQNSMDAVADRDFVIELLSAIAITGMHLSRLCEDLILWVTAEFDFIRIDDAFCTGSSIMPHKKNPDVLELIRGNTSKFPGRLCELLILMKSLPLTYNRDMQLDKPALFECVEALEEMLPLMAQLFKGIKVNGPKIAQAIESQHFYSVDILEYLVKKGVSSRDAHDIVGTMVKECLDKGVQISDLSDGRLKKFSKHFGPDVKKLLKPEISVKIKRSTGSTNPGMVKNQIASWKKKLK
ncbi:MAG: argininosuccinate lyase [Omnitrophica WOR_2 bacterium RIFCSPHIGHO2_02_FULL_52_10]|nr:MAG: argininosuccinate lyase [Omnitrophica WOR_2 bacterium RIFCSPHIGHO2_02_FULL_52_10]